MAKYGFLGTGNMAAALITAAAKGGCGPDCLLTNRTRAKAEALAAEYGCAVASGNLEVAETCEYIFLGVKPQMMAGVLAEIAPVLQKRMDGFVLVSMAAGLTIDTLKRMVGFDAPVVRIMPNTPCAIGMGVVLVTPDNTAAPAQVDEICNVLNAAGAIDRVDEKTLDAGSVVAGCTPAWAYLFIEGLADGAVEAGIPRPQALAYAAKAVEGAAALVLESGRHPGQLKDAVCSPGGSTIAGVHALERAGLRAAAMDAVKAAFDRTNEMAKG